MASQSWMSLINPASVQATGAGALLSGAGTATISPVTGGGADVVQVLPPGQPGSWYPGMVIRLLAHGVTTFTGSGTTLTFFLASRVGNTGSTYVTLASTGSITGASSAIGAVNWRMSAIIRCLAVATSGNTLGIMGEMPFEVTSTAPSYVGTANTETAYMPSGGEAAVAVDTTQLQGLSLRCTITGANVSTQVVQWLAEAVC